MQHKPRCLLPPHFPLPPPLFPHHHHPNAAPNGNGRANTRPVPATWTGLITATWSSTRACRCRCFSIPTPCCCGADSCAWLCISLMPRLPFHSSKQGQHYCRLQAECKAGLHFWLKTPEMKPNFASSRMNFRGCLSRHHRHHRHRLLHQSTIKLPLLHRVQLPTAHLPLPRHNS